MQRTWAFALWTGMALSALGAAGCSSSGDDDDDDDSSSTSGDARKKCNNLVQQFCDSIVGCEVEGGFVDASDQDSEIASCVSDTTESADCANAVDVTTSYDECMSMLANPPCDDINQALSDGTLGLPDSCNGVILTQ
jgi:hypothetical protein